MEISSILKKHQFHFNKRFGQNFISDGNLLAAIADDAAIEKEDTVIEIGAGAGTLTAALAAKAKRVIAFEIDENLAPVLEETLAQYDNVQVVFGDFLKVGKSVLDGLSNFRVCANLPYYITTPIVMDLLENYNPKSITVMVQKEVAERFCADADEEAYGAITLSIAARGNAVVTRNVSRKMFYPEPNVDSAVVRIDCKQKYDDKTTDGVLRLTKAAFSMRRKTLSNNLAQLGIAKEQTALALESIGLSRNARGESLSLENYVELYNYFNK